MKRLLLFAVAIAALYAVPARADDCTVVLDNEVTVPVENGAYYEHTIYIKCSSGAEYKVVSSQLITNGSYAGWSNGYYQLGQNGLWTGGIVSEGPGQNPYYTPHRDAQPADETCFWVDGVQ